MMEEWKDIKGYEGLYQVSSYGRIFSIRRNLYLKPRHNTDKLYQYVILYNKGKYKNYRVHRLVATHFIDKPSGKDFVNHIDGNKENNRVDNLEWCTHQENINHAIKILNHTKNIKVICLETKQTFNSIKDASNYYKLDSSSLAKHLKRKKYYGSFAGLHWKYA